MRELDELLQGFHRRCYDCLDPGERQTFETLLGYPDTVLLEWLMGRQIPVDADVARLVQRIRDAVEP
jgi:succinate dehydrogenase flavin-adding protein (antitoxin of CptAB toxin-antitoxin module)